MFRNQQRKKTNNDPILQEINRLTQYGASVQERGRLDEALQTYQQGLQLARLHGYSQNEQVLLNSQGAVLAEQKRYPEAEQCFQNALKLAQNLHLPVLIARSQNNIGELYAAQKDWVNAQQYHQYALDAARPTGDAATIILSLENLARDYLEQDNASYAVRLLQEAVTLAQAQQNIYLGAGALGRLGEATIANGDKTAGRTLLERALHLSHQVGRNRLTLRWMMKLAEMDMNARHYHAALQRFQKAEDLAHRAGGQSSEFFMMLALNISESHLHLGQFQPALSQAQRALRHATEQDDKIGVAKATGYMGLALRGLKRYEDAIQKLQDGLGFYSDGTLSGVDEQARLLLALGRSQHQHGDTDEALVSYQQVLELTNAEENPVRRAEALQFVASLHNTRLERDQAINLYQEAQRLYEQAKETHKVARTLCDIGSTRRAKGDFNGALTEFENALVLLTNIDDRVTRGLVLSNAAIIYTEMGDIETARSFFEDAIKLARNLGDRYAESVRLGNLGWLYIATGKISMAIETLEKALELSRQQNDPLPVAIQTNNLGWAHHLNGDDETAISLLKQALLHIEKANSVQWRGIVKSNLGAAYLDQGELTEARQLLDEGLADSITMQDQEAMVRTQTRQAALLLTEDKTEEAETLVLEAESSARRMGFRKGQADAAQLLGDIYAGRGNEDKARSYYQEAQRLYQMIQDPVANDVLQ